MMTKTPGKRGTTPESPDRKRHRSEILKSAKSLSDSRLRDSFANKNPVYFVHPRTGELLCNSCARPIPQDERTQLASTAAADDTDECTDARDQFLRDCVFKPTWHHCHWRTFLCQPCTVRATQQFARSTPACMNCLAAPHASLRSAPGQGESGSAPGARSQKAATTGTNQSSPVSPDDLGDDGNASSSDEQWAEGSTESAGIELIEHQTRWACANQPGKPRVVLLCQYCTALCEVQLETVRYSPG